MMLSLLLALTGCPRTETKKTVEIYALTAPPPAKTAQVVSSDREHRVVMNRGVAVAVASWTSCPGQPATALLPGDPAILDTRTVYRNGAANQFVVWGRASGTTTLTVRNDCAEQRYDVTVLAD
jgi:hypothetical protein